MKIKILILSILLMPSLFAADTTQGDQLTVEESREVYRYIEKLFEEVNASGDLERIRSDISLGKFGINTIYRGCETALLMAVDCNYKDIVQKLLSLGANPNIYCDRQTPLALAVIRGKEKIIEMLIQAGADLNLENEISTPLILAINTRRSRILRMLIDAGADINLKSKRISGFPLIVATEQDNLQIVQFLLRKGANVNLQYHRYGTALHAAVSKGHYAIVKALLDAGADVNICNIEDRTPINEAVFQCYERWVSTDPNEKNIRKCIALLLSRGAKYTEHPKIQEIRDEMDDQIYWLLRFVAQNRFRSIKYKIEYCYYVPQEVKDYIHAKYQELFRAVKSNDFEMIQQLLDEGLSINIKDKKGNNLLESAIKARNFELASYIASQADLSSVDFNDNTILHLIIYVESQIDKDINSAQERVDIDACNKLLEHKRQLNILLRKFIERDPSLVNTQNADGNTPLHLAVDYEVGQDTIDTLLSNGASTKIFNINNERAIHMALCCKPPHVLEIFMNAVYKKHNYDEAEAIIAMACEKLAALILEKGSESSECASSDCEGAVIAPMSVDDDMVIE